MFLLLFSCSWRWPARKYPMLTCPIHVNLQFFTLLHSGFLFIIVLVVFFFFFLQCLHRRRCFPSWSTPLLLSKGNWRVDAAQRWREKHEVKPGESQVGREKESWRETKASKTRSSCASKKKRKYGDIPAFFHGTARAVYALSLFLLFQLSRSRLFFSQVYFSLLFIVVIRWCFEVWIAFTLSLGLSHLQGASLLLFLFFFFSVWRWNL